MISPQQALSERIQLHRKRLGWSQAQLAEAVGVSQDTVSRWEKGKGVPSAIELCELSRVFEVALDYLVGRTVMEHGLPSGMFMVDMDLVASPRVGEEWAVQIPTNVKIMDHASVRRLKKAGVRKIREEQ